MTRRKMVDGLTPNLSNFGLRKERMGADKGGASGAAWSPFSLVVGEGSGWEDAGCGSLSAGWRAGTDPSWAVVSDSGSGMKDSGRLRLSLNPISPRLVGNGSAWGRVMAGSGEAMGEEGERVAMTSRLCVLRDACTWQVCPRRDEEPGLGEWGVGEKVPCRL